MKILNIQAARSALRRTPLGSAMLSLACLLALLVASDLRVYANQWAPSDSVAVNAGNAGSVQASGAPMNLEATRKLLMFGNPPELGSTKAPVTIVEFADFECSHCRKMNDLLEKQLLPAENNKVKIAYRYFPLPQHSWARPAAQMAACVELQDKDAFWKLHDFFYANQGSFSASSLQEQVEDFLAKQTKLDIKDFVSCVDHNATAGQVEDDIRMANNLGIRETPTLFVNGIQLHRVHELQQLEGAIDSALKDKTTAKLDP